MNLNKLFDAVYYINLDCRTDRLKHFWDSNRKFLCRNSTVRISAFDAKNSEGLHGFNSVMKARAAHLVSYSKPFNDALKNNFKNILILEDDAEPLTSDITEAHSIISNCQKTAYDILFLGGTVQSKLSKENDFLYKVKNNVLTTHAISFRNNNKLFEKMSEKGKDFNTAFNFVTRERAGFATDLLTSELTLNYSSFITNKLIYGQYENFSDIDGVNAPRNQDMISRFERFT